VCQSRGVQDMARRLLHQSPSPTAAASSTLAPAASSAVPNKAPSLNHGILNLQILQHGGDATPPGSFTNFIQPNLSQQFNFVGESSQFASIQAATEFARFWVPQDFQSKEEFSTFLIHQGTIHMLMFTAVIRHLRLRSESFGHTMKMSGW